MIGGFLNIEALVRDYVDAALHPRLAGMRSTPDPYMPAAMYDSSRMQTDDWRPWKPVPSTVTDEQLDRLEEEIGLRFPPSYRTLLKYKHFYALTEGGLRFERHVIGRWEDTLLAAYDSWDPERIVGAGLIPFGSESFMDAGPVCFDTGNRLPDGECPVVYWDHEWIGTEKEVQPMFSSSLKMFEALRFLAENGWAFFHHDEKDRPADVAKKVGMVRRFLAIDPEGAGGPAREYWTCWLGAGEI